MIALKHKNILLAATLTAVDRFQRETQDGIMQVISQVKFTSVYIQASKASKLYGLFRYC